jgi:uncharacterized membrane protein (DUF106 family)
MVTFLAAIGTVLTASVGWIAEVTTALLGNEIFQIEFALVILAVIVGIILTIVSRIKVRAPRK